VAALEAIHDRRAIVALTTLLSDSDPALAQAAAEALASFAEAGAVEALRRLLAPGNSAPTGVRLAAVQSLGRLHRAGRVDALDVLLDRLLDERESDDLRLCALDAIADLRDDELAPLVGRLVASASVAVAARARTLHARSAPPSATDARELLARLLASPTRPEVALEVAQTLRALGPDVVEPIHRALERTEAPLVIRTLAEVLGHFGAPASITILHRALERLGGLAPADDGTTAETRAAVHVGLAMLDSRIALYALREALAERPPLAARRLLDAASRIGDASLVPAIVALAHDAPPFFDACARALAAIVARERLTRRGRALKGVPQRLQLTLEKLWRAAARTSR
jgi:HEAT repeat protein